MAPTSLFLNFLFSKRLLLSQNKKTFHSCPKSSYIVRKGSQNVFVGLPGNVNDSKVLHISKLYKHVQYFCLFDVNKRLWRWHPTSFAKIQRLLYYYLDHAQHKEKRTHRILELL
jgi:hypothetical protein